MNTIPLPERGNHAGTSTGNKTYRHGLYFLEPQFDMGRPKQKQRYTSQQVQAMNTPGTLAHAFKAYIEESRKPGSRPIGQSRMYGYLAILRSDFSMKMVVEWKVLDLIGFIKGRRAEGVSPCTAGHDFNHIHVVLQWAVEVAEILPDTVLVLWKKAKRSLVSDGIIGKARVRTQRHEPQWQKSMLEYFAKQNDHAMTETNMVDVYEFSLDSARRISETCRIRVKDVDLEKRLYWVYDVKNPKGKGVHMQFPLFGRALEIVKRRIEALGTSNPEARIFPYHPKTCSQRFTMAKKALGIDAKDFVLHGARRECASVLFEKNMTVPKVQKVTGHLQPHVLLTNYTSINPADVSDELNGGPNGL